MTQDNDNNKQPNITTDIEAVSKKLHIDMDWARELTPQDVIYLLDRCPFLQLMNLKQGLNKEDKPVKFIEATSGWIIHDYGDAMSSSPGKFLFGGGDFRIYLNEQDGEGGSILNPGKGTTHKQAFDTAVQMIEIARERGWRNIKLVDGHPKMLRAAWIKAGQLGLNITGFEPNENDKRIRDLVNLSADEVEVLRSQIRPTSAA